jgi:hypothetical protein
MFYPNVIICNSPQLSSELEIWMLDVFCIIFILLPASTRIIICSFLIQMVVHEFPAKSTINDLLESVGVTKSIWSPYRFPRKEELRPRVNNQPISDLTQKLNMGDVVELTPKLPHKSLPEYREEIQRMYDGGLTISGRGWGN